MTRRKNQKLSVDLYFAYGSNLDIEQMQWRCRTAKPIGRAKLAAHLLMFRGVADIAPTRDGRGYVPGGLWRITAADLKALDRYEGYPTLYRRFVMEVETADGKTVKAWTYIMARRGYQSLPSRSYLDTILRGYADFELTADERPTLNDALARAARHLRRQGITRVVEVGKVTRPVYAAQRPATRLPRGVTAGMSPATRAEIQAEWALNTRPFDSEDRVVLAEREARFDRAEYTRQLRLEEYEQEAWEMDFDAEIMEV